MTDLNKLFNSVLPGIRIPVKTVDGFSYLTADKISFIQIVRNKALIQPVHGDSLESILDHADLFNKLKNEPGWFKPHRDYLINLNNLREISKTGTNSYNLIFSNDHTTPLTSTYAPKLKKILNLKSLEHVIPFNRVAYWIMKEGLKDIEKPIAKMSREELIEHFGSTGVADVIVSDLIANFLWQYVNFIRDGIYPPLDGGNIRSLWYLVKPVLSRVNALGGMDHYKTLSKILAHFVAHHIMSYREFGLTEEGNWSIGTTNPHIILVAEKRAHYYFLKRMQKETGVSIIALGGKPKTITSEYFSHEFKQNVSGYFKKDIIKVIALVDYDPSGWIISDTFIEDLRIFGIKHADLFDLVLPDNFSQDEIDIYKYSLLDPNDQGDDGEIAVSTEISKWIKRTGGVNGEAYGIETDALMLDPVKVKQLFMDTATPFLEKQPKTQKTASKQPDLQKLILNEFRSQKCRNLSDSELLQIIREILDVY